MFSRLFATIVTLTAVAVGISPPALAQQPTPSPLAENAALDRVLGSITETDWSRESALTLVERALSQATLEELRMAAEAGDPRAETILAMVLDFGLRGQPTDTPTAIRLYTSAAEKGFATAQEYLAGHYERGDGVEANVSEAVRLHGLAADQGYPRAQINLGFIYLQGELVQQDYAEAMRLFRAAATNGNQHGMRNLGMMYERGLGTQRDLGEALRWYRQAAQLGFVPAQNDLRRLGVSWSPTGDL